MKTYIIITFSQAEAMPGQVPDPCKVELEDAKWYTREQVETMR